MFSYMWSGLGPVVRLLRASAAYRLAWMREWTSASGLSPSDATRLSSNGEPSLKKRRLRERTATHQRQRSV